MMRFVVICFSLLPLFLSGGAFSVQAADKTYTNSIGMEFVLIPSGSFTMGTADDIDAIALPGGALLGGRDIMKKIGSDTEKPAHKVSISKPFYLGRYEVTQAQWMAVMGDNPSSFEGRSNPVDGVDWGAAQEFIKRLNQLEGHNRYRLPTEAEWEYAARGGTDTMFFFKNPKTLEEAERQLDAYAWFRKNSGKTTHPVGQKKPNPYGLYDVYGNVWEWVQDWFDEEYYSNSPDSDPKGPPSGYSRVFRGGTFESKSLNCRSAERYDLTMGPFRTSNFGFRLALSLEEDPSAPSTGAAAPATTESAAPRLASKPAAGTEPPKTRVNSIDMEFVLIPAGSFTMGEPGVLGASPRHQVTLSRPFYLGRHEVTQAQWTAVMGNNPSRFKGRDNPVERVSWKDTQEFIKRLNQKEGHNRYRLPTEAEWEYAARGGTDAMFFFMKRPETREEAERQLDAYAWFKTNSGETTHPVGRKKPNPYGLYDMYGNVLEWVRDRYMDYPSAAMTDPKGPSSGSNRVLRGGSWGGDAGSCRSAYRVHDSPDARDDSSGFRLALSPE
ncbi:MAG: formylglycine-generating enzyme family protein [Desulfovibrio sp.]|jgi:formylglycine-generating enzyme required for sulfatase activity|nr:formylglycine-generating enzyme family protein [Desulfovibrio sp.]